VSFQISSCHFEEPATRNLITGKSTDKGNASKIKAGTWGPGIIYFLMGFFLIPFIACGMKKSTQV